MARRTQPVLPPDEGISSDLQLDEAPPTTVQETTRASTVSPITAAPATQRQEVALTSNEDNFLKKLIESGKLPGHVRTIEDAFTIGKMGKELGFPIMQSFHQIIPIQGKLTLSAKALGALLRKANIRFKTIEDAVYVYRDNTTSEYARPLNYTGTGDVRVCTNPEDKPVDRRTTLLFTRDGEEEKVSFGWTEATLQGLTTKDNWKRMPNAMLYARCIAKGANRIAQDVVMGLYSADEMFDSLNIAESQVRRDENGHIESVITPHEEITTAVAA